MNVDYMKYEYSALICEYLVALKVQEVFQEAVLIIRQKEALLKDIPVLISSHDFDSLIRLI